MAKKNNKPKKDDEKVLTSIYKDALRSLDEMEELIRLQLNLKYTSLDGKSRKEVEVRTLYLSNIVKQTTYSFKATRDIDIVEYLANYLLFAYITKKNRQGYLRVPLSVFSKLDKNMIDEIFSWYDIVTSEYADSIKELIMQKDIITEADIRNLLDKTPILMDISSLIIVNKDQGNLNENRFSVAVMIQGSTKDLTIRIGEILRNFFTRLGFKVEGQQFLEQSIKFSIII
ncbi:hypothetical protein [Stygiolobus azoricus]|uniref:Uncharacterized protein n=1 Tax=Stygiolobus azoricus TaxID=41675 RepID=A0A650CLV4_9CREN|nr:hypothetical protein [Stygiolobus azoricus]QGR18723.1 hypothetical protein D1868_01055 [Stygiolobus azoricus]